MITNNITPREKIIGKGAQACSDEELLQAIIGNGTKDNDYVKISKNTLKMLDEENAAGLTASDFMKIAGIGEAKAILFEASLELWKRRLVKSNKPKLFSPEDAVDQLQDIADKMQEHFVLLTLDGARRLIKKRIVSIGTLMASLVHPREIFAYAVEDRAASIIVAHNHPSGDLIPSENDREVTARLRQAGDIMGIRLDDHLIINRDLDFVSAI